MIAAVDIETKGLDATQFVMGCLMLEGKRSPEIYNDKNKLWERIIDLGRKEQARGKTLNLYAHNAAFDFYGYADIKDRNITWFCHRPFIVAYRQPRLDEPGVKQEIIKFLDTLSIFKMPLKSLGAAVGLHKMETPEELMDEQMSENIDAETLMKITPYCVRDTEIVLKSIMELKKILKDNDITIKRLYTINQIAINFLINHWRQNKEYHHVFWDHKKGETRRTFRSREIHEAYRGGRVEAFRTGKFEYVNYVDCNSLYPHAAKNIRFPLLESERKTYEPLKNMETGELLKRIGISRCMIRNNDCELGLLPIRTQTGSYYPKKGKVLIGTWTHMELAKALEEGYELVDIEWSVTWDDAPNNPFISYVDKLYEMKKNAENNMQYYFAKMCMNAAFGKLAQTRTSQEIVMDSVEKAQEYIKNNWEIIKGVDLNYMYKRNSVKQKHKKYYTPILPTMINAMARCYMYDMYKKVGSENLIYTDTDSIMCIGDPSVPITEEMGDFKVEHEEQTAIVYGKKTYIIGEEARIAGFRKKDVTQEEFERGEIVNHKMLTINTTNDVKKCGKFVEEKRDLKKQMEEGIESGVILNDMQIYTDCNLTNINYFIDKVSSLLSD